MLIASLADLHIRGSDLDQAVAQLDTCLEAIERAKADLVIIAGDVFDHPNVGDRYASTSDQYSAVIDTLHTRGYGGNEHRRDILAIPGNHDKINDASGHATKLLDQSVWNWETFGQPVVIDPSQPNEPFIWYVPWVWSEDLVDVLARLKADEDRQAAYLRGLWTTPFTRILVGHIRVKGAKFNATREIGEGICTIDKETLEKYGFDRLLLGDIHLRQEVLPGKGGYIGAMRQLNFGEEGNPAGFELYDTETGAVQWIEISEAPQYKTVRWLEGEAIDADDYPNTNLRLQAYHWQPTAAQIKAYTQQGIRVDVVAVPSERVRRGETTEDISNDDDKALLDLWLDQQEPAPSATKRKALQKELTNLTV